VLYPQIVSLFLKKYFKKIRFMLESFVESIYKATKDNEKLIAEMARQLSISYCPSSDPSSRVVHPDYFPFSTIPF
jgi:hypothetical protein